MDCPLDRTVRSGRRHSRTGHVHGSIARLNAIACFYKMAISVSGWNGLARWIEWRRIGQWLSLVILFASPASSRSGDAAAPADRFATLVELNGPIGPAMSLYFERSLAAAGTERSAVVILQMDTPGGLDTSMRDIIKAILASPVPVVSYVAPSGARAASA